MQALLLFLGLSGPAWADLSFVQVVQAQTSHGREGVFGKTWVQLSGRRMRLVSGYAAKLREGSRPEEPTRLIQLVDLDAKQRVLLYPETRSYSRAPLDRLDYDRRLAARLSRGEAAAEVELDSVELSREGHSRRMLAADCEHYRVRAKLRLVSPDGALREARMDQDVWVAPLSGPLSETLLELIAFENGYRDATGGALSPLDHERYQLREAAAYLRASPEGLRRAVERIRERLRSLPSYPVASSVSWWLPEEQEEGEPSAGAGPGGAPDKRVRMVEPVSLGNVKPKRPVPQSHLAARKEEDPAETLKRRLSGPIGDSVPAYAGGRRRRPPLAGGGGGPPVFKVIDWSRSERKINQLYRETRDKKDAFPPLRPPRSAPRRRPPPREEPTLTPRVQRDMKEIVALLINARRLAEAELGGTREDEEPQPAPPPPRELPFYEAYAELHGLEVPKDVAQAAFQIPPGYSEQPGPEK